MPVMATGGQQVPSLMALHLFKDIMYFCLSACMSVHPVSTWCPQRLEKGTQCQGTRVTGACELPCGNWEPNLGPKSNKCF